MKRFILNLFIFLFILVGFVAPNKVNAKNSTQNDFITAQGAILMEKSTNRVLLGKNVDLKLPMASCTKILTAITVIENSNLDKIVTIPKQAVGVEGSSIYLKENEQLTVRELLYGLMLRSGNDCAVALALHVSKSIDNFMSLMNETAKKIGATNSNFETPHGLDSKNHYTTAFDLGLITCYALNNNTFCDIVSSKKVEIGSTATNNYRVLYNKNKLLNNFEYADGVKTGFTKKSGRCFVGSATKDNMQLVAVVLNCGPMFEETEKMLKYGFDNYQLKTVVYKNKIYKDFNSQKTYICENKIKVPLKTDNSENDKVSINICDDCTNNPHLKIFFDNKLLFLQKLSIIKR